MPKMAATAYMLMPDDQALVTAVPRSTSYR